MKLSLKRIFEVYVFAYAFFFASRPLSDGDFWWHLKTGEYISHNHAIPRTDLFSFTNFGRPWVAHEWLSDLIFYFTYYHFGFNVLIFIFALITAAAFWLVYRRCESHAFLSALATLLAVASVLPTLGVRPRAFTLLFASIFLFVLTRYSQRGETRHIWWLVPLMIMWVNLHAGYLIGLVLLGITIVGVLLDGWSDRETLAALWPKIRTASLVLVACTLAAVLNPQGLRIFSFPFEFFFSPVQQNQVIDWLSPNFHQKEFLPLALLILLTLGAMALSPRRVKLSELLLVLSTLYATLKSNRHVAIFALVAAPLFANYLQLWIDSSPLEKSFSRERSSAPSRAAHLFGVLLVLPLAVLVLKLNREIYSPPRQEMVGVPLRAVSFMKAQGLTGRTFTDPNIWSGYLIWAMPTNPVYIDGRIDMYGDQFVENYINLTYGLTDWRGPFERLGITTVIAKPQSFLATDMANSQHWRSVYRDDMAIVFRKIEVPN